MTKSLEQIRIEAMVRRRHERELESNGMYLDNEARLLGHSQNIHQIAAMPRINPTHIENYLPTKKTA